MAENETEHDLDKTFVVHLHKMAIIEADSASEAVVKFNSGEGEIQEKLDVESAKVAMLRMAKNRLGTIDIDEITKKVREFVDSLPDDVEATVIPLGAPSNRSNDKMN